MKIELGAYEHLAIAIGGSRERDPLEVAYEKWVAEHKMYWLELPTYLPRDENLRQLYKGKWKKILTPEELEVLSLRYGLAYLHYGQHSTYEQIGAQLGVEKKKVKKIEANALGKLRKFCATEFPRPR